MKEHWFVAFGTVLVAAGCGSNPEAPPEPLLDLECPTVSTPSPLGEVESYIGFGAQLQFDRCGGLIAVENGPNRGWRLDPEGGEPVEFWPANASSVLASALGDQAFVGTPTGERSWVRLDDPDRVIELESNAIGFVRDGDRQIAWACQDDMIGTVDETGFTPRVEVAICDRAWASPTDRSSRSSRGTSSCSARSTW